ncbi:MAG: ATP-binding protein [Calditrichia bacterium]
MIFRRWYTLKFRLMTLITAMLLLIVGLPIALYLNQMDKNYQEFSENMIETTSQVIYQFLYEAMLRNDKSDVQNYLELISLEPTIDLARIYNMNGKVVFSSRPEEVGRKISDLSPDVLFINGQAEPKELFEVRGNLVSHHHLIYVDKECLACHQSEGEVIAVLDVHAGFTQSEFLHKSSQRLVILGGILIIVLLWVIINLIYQSLVESKLQAIVKGFSSLAEGDYNTRVSFRARHELGFLAEKFNDMVDKLRQAKIREEQFFLEKLERADRLVTLGEVAAEIAHEVNNPAGIILTRAEILKDEIGDMKVEAPCRKDLEIIIQQTEKIAETTRTILHYAKKLPRTFSKTDLVPVIKNAVLILEPRIKKLGVKVEFALPDEPVLVWGNANQLEQVFCNLINNSLSFLPKKDGKIKIGLYRNGVDSLIVEYQDNGPGIPPAHSEKIFSPFFTTKTDGKGTGLGLFIVKNILANHKANIWVDQNFKEGAKFVIEFEGYHGDE